MRVAVCATLASLGLFACATGVPRGVVRRDESAFVPFSPPALARSVPRPQPDGPVVPLVASPGARSRVVDAAVALVGKRTVVVDGHKFGDDCTGLVRAAYHHAGIDVMRGPAEVGDNGVTAIYRFATQHGRIYDGGRPVPGDMVFFRDTYDINRDGQINDGLTHIGLVERTEDDGTVIVIHRVARGVVRYRMNLRYPAKATSPEGRPVNDWLRSGSPGAAPLLTSQLFVSYATVLPLESNLAASR